MNEIKPMGVGGEIQRIAQASAAAERSLKTAAEVAAMAGLPGEFFDAALNRAREAFRAKTKEIARHAD